MGGEELQKIIKRSTAARRNGYVLPILQRCNLYRNTYSLHAFIADFGLKIRSLTYSSLVQPRLTKYCLALPTITFHNLT
jgi:hypothetical protein